MITLAQFVEILAMPAVQRAAIALFVGSIGLPLIGVAIIGLDIMPVRFAMMHVALLGIAIGLLTGLEPILCALVACALAGGSMTPLATSPSGLSGAMGLLMSLAIAGALLVLAVSGVNAASAFELLWGSILGVQPLDLALLGAIAVVVPALFLWQHNNIAMLFSSRELAIVSGVRVNWLTGTLLVLIAVSIASAIRLTGALLVDALTLLPALAARRLGRTLVSICVWAIAVSLVANTTGFLIAILFDLPPGPVLVLTAGTIALFVNLIPRNRKGKQCVTPSPAPSLSLH